MLTSLRRKYFGNLAFYRMALAVAVPIMIQDGITQFVGLLDNIMVGRVGTEQMTGVSIANTLIFVFQLSIFGAVSGAGIYGAQFYGSKNEDGVRSVFRFKLMICGLLTLLGCGLFYFFGDSLILLYLKGEGSAAEIEASLGYARNYLLIMLPGLIPFALSQTYSSTLREGGQTVVPMVSGITSVLINLTLNGILIFGAFGLPALGSDGAAVATVIARIAEAGVVMIWTHTHAEKVPFIRGAWRSFRIPKKRFAAILKKALPLMVNETLWAGAMAMLTQCYSLHGYDVVSASNIANTIANVFNVAFLAMGSAIGIIVGQLLGADQLEEAADTDRKLIVFAVGICFFIGGIMAAVSPLFPKIFNTTEEIRSLAADFILILALCMPINSLANACYFTLRSGGKTIITFIFDSFYVWGFTVPLAFCLSLFTSISIVPLFLVCQLADLGKGIVGVILIRKGLWIQNIVKE